MEELSRLGWVQMNAELAALDHDKVRVGEQWLSPSQCYRVSENFPYILYNTNCPGDLKEKIEEILSRYRSNHESRPQE